MRRVPIKDLITLDELKSLIKYDPNTGYLTRLVTTNYNSKKGDIIKCVDAATGYVCFNLNRRIYSAHRIALFYVTGVWPDYVDHINGIKTDNRLCNLRSGSHGQNLQNYKKANSHNKSGLLGAHLVAKTGQFSSEIIKNKKRYHLGFFDTAEEAHEAYIAAKRKLHEFNTL